MRPVTVKISRWIFTLAAGLFLAGVIYQVFLAGQAAVTQRGGWGAHAGFGHLLAGPLVLLLIFMFPAKTSRRVKGLSALLFAVYFIQADVVIFMRSDLPHIAAVHPVLALFDFLLGFHLVRASLGLLRSGDAGQVAARESQSAPHHTLPANGKA